MPWLPSPPCRSQQLMQLVRYNSTVVLLALNKGMLNLSIETKWSRPWSTSLFSTNWHFKCLSYRSLRSNVNKIIFHLLLLLLCTHSSECTTFHVKMKSKWGPNMKKDKNKFNMYFVSKNALNIALATIECLMQNNIVLFFWI